MAIRLSADELRLLEETGKRLKVGRSTVVRDAIARYAEHIKRAAGSPAERLSPWLGKYDDWEPSLGTEASKTARRLIVERHARRSR